MPHDTQHEVVLTFSDQGGAIDYLSRYFRYQIVVETYRTAQEPQKQVGMEVLKKEPSFNHVKAKIIVTSKSCMSTQSGSLADADTRARQPLGSIAVYCLCKHLGGGQTMYKAVPTVCNMNLIPRSSQGSTRRLSDNYNTCPRYRGLSRDYAYRNIRKDPAINTYLGTYVCFIRKVTANGNDRMG